MRLQRKKNVFKKYQKSLLPGLQVFQTLCENKGVLRDDFAKVRAIHPDVFEKEQSWSHISVEVKSQ